MQGFRGGIQELVRQTSRMQRKVEEAKTAIKNEEVTSTSAGGKVSCTVTCEGKVSRVVVDPDFYKDEGHELVLDAIVAATNSALELADKRVDEAITKATGGVKIPGM